MAVNCVKSDLLVFGIDLDYDRLVLVGFLGVIWL